MQQWLHESEAFIKTLARVSRIKLGEDLEKPSYSAFAAVHDVDIFVPLERSRMEEEMRRIEKEVLKVDKEIDFVRGKLSNEQFILRARPEVVSAEREKESEYTGIRKRLEENLKKIKEALG